MWHSKKQRFRLVLNNEGIAICLKCEPGEDRFIEQDAEDKVKLLTVADEKPVRLKSGLLWKQQSE